MRNLAFVLLKTDVFRKEIKQGTNARRKRSALADIDGIELFDIAGIELFQHGNKPIRRDIGADGEFGHAGKTGARECEVTHGFAIADLQAGGEGNGDRLAGLNDRPAFQCAGIGKADAAMIVQVSG